jgi:rhodanese-related sulfurtransferase
MTSGDDTTVSIDTASLQRLLHQQAVQLLDVRRAPVFGAATDMLAGASWRDPAEVADWAAGLDRQQPVVVYCVHGHAVSQGAAQALRERGFDARFLAGGFEAWRDAGLPLQPKPV